MKHVYVFASNAQPALGGVFCANCVLGASRSRDVCQKNESFSWFCGIKEGMEVKISLAKNAKMQDKLQTQGMNFKKKLI